MRQQWLDLMRSWAVAPSLAREAFADVSTRYAEAGRYYHVLAHISNVLETLESIRFCAENWNALRLAAWLHDVVYNSRASDNEERSADYAVALCDRLRI